MKTILVTGGTGFIGSHTNITLLENGYYVIVIDSNINSSKKSIKRISQITKKKNQEILFRKGDIRSERFLNKVFLDAKLSGRPITAVIHFAGLKSIEDSIKYPLLYWDVNIKGSINLFKVMDKFNCHTIVFSSSASIYGFNNGKKLLESSEIKPQNPYAYSKASIEYILDEIYKSSGKEWKIAKLRYFNPIGAHPSGLVGEEPLQKVNNLFPYLCGVASGKYKELKIFGNDWPTNDGTCVRDYIHVMDLAESHLCALEFLLKKKTQNVSINIGTGKGTSVLGLLEAFNKINNFNLPYKFVTRRFGDVPVLVADNKLAISTLNWMPKRTLEDMCKDGWNWQNSNPGGYL